ncbi:MAG: amino acid permease [Bacteroidales bacterium]|nr:amino acid permease [Bacteroidales bacterium]
MSQKGLRRSLGLFPATNIVIANIIGAGIFTTSGLLMADLGSPALLIILWIAGGIIAICGALSYGELGANIPEAGGEYLFLSRIFHPSLGFLSGWVSFIVGFSAAISASALGSAEYMLRGLPHLAEWFSANTVISTSLVSKIIAVLIVLIFTLIHSRGIESGSKVQNLLTIIKVILIALIIIAGLSSGRGDISNFTKSEPLTGGLGSYKTIGLSVMWIMYAYSGWNASTYIGSEIKNPGRNLPASLLIGTGIVIVLFVLVNMVYIYAIPPDEMKGVISIGGLAMGKLFGKGAEIFFSLIISFALFSSLSAYIIIGPRVYYAMAKDGLFFKSVSRIHPRFNVPARAIYLQSLISIIIIITGTFDQIITYLGFSLGVFPILVIAGSFKLRREKKIKIRIKGYPVPQIIYMLAGIIILILSFMQRPVESSIALATIAVGIPAYILFRRYN